MELEVLSVSHRNTRDLIRYCAQHGSEHDDSYLPGKDYSPSPEQPSYLLVSDRSVVGAVSLLRTPRYAEAGKGRFSILHSTLETAESYSNLLEAIRPHFYQLQTVYLFIPESKTRTAEILIELGFQVERYSFVLINQNPVWAKIEFPAGLTLEALEPTDRERIRQFAECVNDSFSELAGHTDLPVDDVRGWFDDHLYLERGICLLMQGRIPVGTICITREYEDRQRGEISALGVIKPYRGRGLGRLLLRYGLSFGVEMGLGSVILSVNAENKSALNLYQSEGFELIDTVTCFALECGWVPDERTPP